MPVYRSRLGKIGSCLGLMESRYAGGSSGFIVDMWVCQGGLGCDGCI